ncbi:hypothetical protein GCM10025331_47810 [Actinoplanes utahensis]|nr:hypothetical protein Aut01nite_26630 [Actinoplanes utahensis]
MGPRARISGVYPGREVLDQIGQVERDLYAHLSVTADGLCATCREPEPCRARYDAFGFLNRYGVLPRRRPGAAGVTASVGQSFNGFAEPHTRSNAAM